MEREERFMRLALQEAEQAMALGEVPVGAVIVRGDEVVSMPQPAGDRQKCPCPCGDHRHQPGMPSSGGLAAASMRALCHFGALPDVFWGDHQLSDSAGSLWRSRRQSRMHGLGRGLLCIPLQPQTPSGPRGVGRGMPGLASAVFPIPTGKKKSFPAVGCSQFVHHLAR